MKHFIPSAITASAIVASCLFVSCQDEDFGYSTNDIRASVYDRNFIAHYGDIDPNQSWDLSSFGLIERINAQTSLAETRGTKDHYDSFCTISPGDDAYGVNLTYTSEREFKVSHDLLQWLKKRLIEKRDNKSEFSQRFSMIATERSFQLMPIYQGIDNTYWDFHVLLSWIDAKGNVITDDRVLWRKSDALYMIGERPDSNGEAHQDYVETFTNLHEIVTSSKNDVKYETTRLAADIETNRVKVSGYPVGQTSVTFELHVFDNGRNGSNQFYSDGREQSGRASNMVVLPVQVQIKEFAGKDFVMLGCETGEDSDLNDIVFLLIGDDTTGKIPEIVNFNNIKKRYFFEDLGSVVDWDFNDVVLDMEQTIDSKTNKIKQIATLKHRCGTTPFDLFLKLKNGEYKKISFTRSELLDAEGHVKGCNEGSDKEFSESVVVYEGDFKGYYHQDYAWIANENNVAIKVYADKSAGYPVWNNPQAEKPGSGEVTTSDGVWSDFKPRYTGEDGKKNIPRVFVADQTVWWTEENVDFPSFWNLSTDIPEIPTGAIGNNNSFDNIQSIFSDQTVRYPIQQGDQWVLWNTPTRFDKWEPLWLSEGFVEGLQNGYKVINVEFGDCSTNFALLARETYRTVDYKYHINGGGDFNAIPSSKVLTFEIPSSDVTLYNSSNITGGSVDWYLNNLSNNNYYPSIGIQDEGYYKWYDEYGNLHEHGGDLYITINKVWMTKELPPLDLKHISTNDFKVTFADLVKAGAVSDDYIICFNISNTSGDDRNNWGNGGIHAYNSTGDQNRLEEWKGKSGSSWTYKYTLGDLRRLTSNGDGIRILTYNQCNVTSIDIKAPVTIWEGTFTADTNHSQLFNLISDDKLQYIYQGGKLKLYFNSSSLEAGNTDFYNSFTKADNYIYRELNNSDVEAIKRNHGLYIKGGTLTKIVIE